MGDLRVVTTAGADTVLPEGSVAEFTASVRGAILRPGDGGYDAARTAYNAMIDRRPALITRCTSAANVIAGVQFARAHNLLVSVRGGAPPEVSVAQPIGHEPASVWVDSEGVDGRQPALGRQVDDLPVVRGEEGPPALHMRSHALRSIALLR